MVIINYLSRVKIVDYFIIPLLHVRSIEFYVSPVKVSS